MKDIPELFADLTALFEDIHGITVEGQRAGLTPDIHEMLLAAVRSHLVRVHRTMIDMAASLRCR